MRMNSKMLGGHVDGTGVVGVSGQRPDRAQGGVAVLRADDSCGAVEFVVLDEGDTAGVVGDAPAVSAKLAKLPTAA